MNFNTVLWIILIGFIIFIVYIYLKSYRKRHDNVSLNTGAPGTGKTLELTKSAKAQYFKNLRKVKWQNRFTNLLDKFRKNKKGLQELPVLISNYPIRMKGIFKAKQFSYMLTKEMVLLHEAVPLKSVFVITEFSSLIHNKDFNNPNAIYNIDEWVRFIRHYLQGGYIFADDQSSDNILVNARRRVGTVYNYLQFKKLPFLPIARVQVRHITISEDIKTIEAKHAESSDNTSFKIIFLRPWPFARDYDTHTFSERYNTVPKANLRRYKGYKTNELIEIPSLKLGSSQWKATKTTKKDID